MATQFTLQKILSQIAANKDKLQFPSSDDEGEPGETAKPVPKVQEIFNEEDLKKRQKEIEEQKTFKPIPTPLNKVEEKVPEYPTHTPLEQLPQDLREELNAQKEVYEIRSVFDLKDLFLMYRDEFDDFQKAALDSIVRVCDTIEVGCKCKRGSRLKIAEDYYVKFITENQHNGLIEKIKKTLNTETIKFYSKDMIFLER